MSCIFYNFLKFIFKYELVRKQGMNYSSILKINNTEFTNNCPQTSCNMSQTCILFQLNEKMIIIVSDDNSSNIEVLNIGVYKKS